MSIMRMATGRARAFLLLGLVLALGACGTDRNPIFPAVFGAVRGIVLPGPSGLPDVRAQLTPEVLAAEDGPVLIVELPSAPTATVMTLGGTNRDTVTFGDAASNLLILRGGVIVGTRGFGFDLMDADVSQTLRALAAGGGRAQRLHNYLDGEGKVLPRRFGCVLSRAGAEAVRLVSASVQADVIVERCEGALGGVFENRYWIAGGQVIKARQWVSPQIGYILTERAK